MKLWLGSLLCRIGTWLCKKPLSSTDAKYRANAKILIKSLFDNEKERESYKVRASRLGNEFPYILERAEKMYIESYGACNPPVRFADTSLKEKGVFIDDAINEYLDLR